MAMKVDCMKTLTRVQKGDIRICNEIKEGMDWLIYKEIESGHWKDIKTGYEAGFWWGNRKEKIKILVIKRPIIH